MRGLTDAEHDALVRLNSPPPVEGQIFDGPTLDGLEECRRVEKYDVDAEGYRIRLTELGRLALRLWPLVRFAAP